MTQGSTRFKNPFGILSTAELRGVAALVTDATIGVTGIVEGVHQSVWRTLGFPGGASPKRARGMTGQVYQGVRGVARVAGAGTQSVLAWLERRSDPDEETRAESTGRDALLSALNGVLGDGLVTSENPLAIRMSFRLGGTSSRWRRVPPSTRDVSGRILVLVHGLCMNDLEQHALDRRHVVEHGQAVASARGDTPVYLRYNSGLHTSENGRELSALLEDLTTHWPVPVEELSVIAHSMGGLVIRSACHLAKQQTSNWLPRLRSIVFLGTPHHGAPLERAGNHLDAILGATPYSAPFASLSQLRSSGITDLRFGHVSDEDWRDRDRFARTPDRRRLIPIPTDVRCYAVAASTAAARETATDKRPSGNRQVGDGLVPIDSALGQHAESERCLAFPDDAQWIAYRTGHMALLNSPEVAGKIKQWLRPRARKDEPGG